MFLALILFALLSLPDAAQADAGAGTPQPVVHAVSLPEIAPVPAEELNRFYALRARHAAWNVSDNAAAKKTLAFIDSVGALVAYHGLDEGGYHLDELRQLAESENESDRQKLELLITASLLHLAHDLHGDSVDLAALYPGWNFHRRSADIPALLNAAIANGRLEEFFDGLAPQNETYRALAKALQAYRAMAARGGWPPVAPGPSLRPGDQGSRVAQLRARLEAEGYAAASPGGRNDFFGDALNKALVAYQLRNGLQPDGHAGPKTLAAINVPIASRIDQIRANMERWRHMPQDFSPSRYTVVNIPDFTATIVEDGNEIYRGEVIDGRIDRPTPFIDSRIVNMVVNPSWHVPISIARKDILPKLYKDPRYLEKLGIVIVGRDSDPSGTAINWKNVRPGGFHYRLRQVPGALNSLGQLKFTFPNPFDVYMHGTPHQELFAKPDRSFSSGCVRLAAPLRVGEILLKDNRDGGGWDRRRIEDAIAAGKTLSIPLAKPMPLYFLYWSVFSSEDGGINFRRDLYGYDSLLIKNMGIRTILSSDNS